MKTKQFFLRLAAFTALISIAGCATADLSVMYDYNKDIDFNSLKTFSWLAMPSEMQLDQRAMGKIKEALKRELEARGLSEGSNAPDFSVAVHFGQKQKLMVTDSGYRYGLSSVYWGGLWGPDGMHAVRHEEGQLIIDFVDAVSKELIWRGTAKGALDSGTTSAERERNINIVIGKILDKFPPPSE
ncbi:DUF4136 domain-containing protein [Thermodesulfobacteriota bacterium]